MEEYPEEVKAILREPEIADLLEIAIIRLDKASAASLFLSLDMRLHQWDTLAKSLNALLPEGEKYKGGVLPNSTTLIGWYESFELLCSSASVILMVPLISLAFQTFCTGC
jgi:hypothetical protein